jgi:hypothetical protein
MHDRRLALYRNSDEARVVCLKGVGFRDEESGGVCNATDTQRDYKAKKLDCLKRWYRAGLLNPKVPWGAQDQDSKVAMVCSLP